MTDILLAAAMRENQRLMRCYAKVAGSASGSTATLSQYSAGGAVGPPGSGGTASGPSCSCPDFVCDWCSVFGTLVAEKDNGFQVCNTNQYRRCGANCNWTVPAGVTRATFQLWAPGGGTSQNCCCGGGPFGPTGSWLLLSDVQVCAGETWCFCAGCAYCCFAEQTTPGQLGCTHIEGCCFCATTCGPMPCYCCWNGDVNGKARRDGGIYASNCNNQIPNVDGCGPNQCSGWNYCWDQNSDNVNVEFAYGYNSWCICCDGNGTCRNSMPSYTQVVPYGVRGMWPGFCISSGNETTKSWSAPVPFMPMPTNSWGANTGWQSQNTCHGCNFRACCGSYNSNPGFGGSPSSIFGGCNACGGDAGRMGMVCVSWNCT